MEIDADLMAEFEGMEMEEQSLNEEIVDLKEQLAEATKQVLALEVRVVELGGQLRHTEQVIGKKDTVIGRLRNKVEVLERKLYGSEEDD